MVWVVLKRRESDSSRHRSPSAERVGMKSADAFRRCQERELLLRRHRRRPDVIGPGSIQACTLAATASFTPRDYGRDHMEGNQGMMTVMRSLSWVVISGLPDNTARVVSKKSSTRGTVVVIKESMATGACSLHSTKEAVRAQHQNDGVMIADGTCGGAAENAQMAQSMGLQLTSDGGFVSANGEDFDGFLAGNEGDVGGSSNGTGGREKQRGAEGREIDPSSDAWTHGADYQLTARDPEYVGVGEARSRTRGGRGGAGDREARTPLRLQGSHVEVTGPVSPSLYLRPLKRDSLCDKIMKFFGFR